MTTRIVTIDLDSRAYDIYIGQGVLYRVADLIPFDLTNRKVFIVTDTQVERYAAQIRDLLANGAAAGVYMLSLPPGEKTKAFTKVEEVCRWLLQNGVSRDSVIFSVGGGVIGDLTGFCASIIMRGVSFIQVPTTLLSQVDSSVGGKTGINTPEGKNLVGTFYQPAAVLMDTDTLQTLPKREILSGYAEILKYALLGDAGFFRWLEQNGERVCALEQDALFHAIEQSCQAKADIVQADERESGKRALLNLGHTFGHALEAAAGYGGTLLHGEAVAIGMVMAFDLSYRLGHIRQEDVETLENHLERVGLRTRASYVDGLATSVDLLMEIMAQDKKVSGGKMTFVLLQAIGEAFLSRDVPEDMVRAVLRDSLGGDKKEAKGQWASTFSSLS